jgi:hypothetical protein
MGDAACRLDDDLPLPDFGGRAVAVEATSAMMAATRDDKETWRKRDDPTLRRR